METVQSMHIHSKFGLPWRRRPSFTVVIFSSKLPRALALPQSSVGHHRPPHATTASNDTAHTTRLVETFHERRRLKDLVQKLTQKGSCPVQTLKDDGNWSRDEFWAVIKFLKHESRSNQILQVFYEWKSMHKSRIDEFNYRKIIWLLGEEGLMEDAVAAFRDMRIHGLRPSLEIYNSLIHGYSRKGKFNDALFFLNDMKKMGLMPNTETYDGLIHAYGKYKMYDEISTCLRNMKLDGCLPDHITYNLLLREFSKAGLLQRMEKVHRTMIFKRMSFQSSTLLAMLEAYANFGVLKNMENAYRRAMSSNIPLSDDLIRQIASVYIKNYMFSRLSDLGHDLSSQTGDQTDLIWCLRLLSHACLLSHRGMGSVVEEMEEAGISWNVTTANIILLAYLKMKDFTHMRLLLSELPAHRVKPDIVTVGVLCDAVSSGFEGTKTLETWRKMGLLNKAVEMKTDSLVLTAFGKGQFLQSCEKAYLSVEPEAREKDVWTYESFISLVSMNTSLGRSDSS